jgi:hypothetical protein
MMGRRLLLLVLAAIVAAIPAQAAVPSTLGYQGLLTDGGGSPVANGSYALGFALYDVSSGGTALWSETQPGVTVTAGGFAVTLGSVTPLSSLAFDRPYWLGIAVDGGAELAPRVELAASPYALSLRTPFAATTNDSLPLVRLGNPIGWPALQVDGVMTVRQGGGFGGMLTLDAPPGDRGIQLFAGNGSGSGQPSGLFTNNPGVNIIPGYLGQTNAAGNAGQLIVGGSTNSRYLSVNGDNGGTGNPRFHLTGLNSQVIFDTNESGDAAVTLPLNAVNPSEILGMPGISQGHGAGTAYVGAVGITPIINTIITTPMAGYVFIQASAQAGFLGTTGLNAIQYQIDTRDWTTATFEAAQLRIVGANAWANTDYQYLTAATSRVYYLPAGTHTLWFLAQKLGAAGTAYFYTPTITATFIPVSYGGVNTSVTTLEGASLPGGDSPIGDLRELELRATRTRLDAERAEHELARAKVEAEMSALRERATEIAARGTRAPAAGR